MIDIIIWQRNPSQSCNYALWNCRTCIHDNNQDSRNRNMRTIPPRDLDKHYVLNCPLPPMISMKPQSRLPDFRTLKTASREGELLADNQLPNPNTSPGGWVDKSIAHRKTWKDLPLDRALSHPQHTCRLPPIPMPGAGSRGARLPL